MKWIRLSLSTGCYLNFDLNVISRKFGLTQVFFVDLSKISSSNLIYGETQLNSLKLTKTFINYENTIFNYHFE